MAPALQNQGSGVQIKLEVSYESVENSCSSRHVDRICHRSISCYDENDEDNDITDANIDDHDYDEADDVSNPAGT